MANIKKANEKKMNEENNFNLPYKIKLNFPVNWGEEKRTEIIVNRRLKAKDFKGIKASEIEFDDMMKLISKITGETFAFIGELDAKDFMKCSEIVQSFL